ncbi:MotA/TolQ/ExbB proton channel family protein [Endozoicomonas lisbonensis]|uniref:Biopolymer transport protein ExbB n=1 Tax=Endozoicomonas lisbonensis TaxID=3120522 RepID=A0ABV2SL08_9GAMM
MPANSLSIATGIPLLLCSVFALAIAIERICFILTRKGLSKQQKQVVLSALKQHQTNDALAVLDDSPTSYQPVIEEMMSHRDNSKAVRDEAIQIMLVRYANQLQRRMSGLITIASLAPMLGLLGTIIGLMRSFRDIGISQGPVEPSVVADGLWQALTTTAAGMLIAVFCVFLHALINSRIRHHLADAKDLLNLFSHSLELQNASGSAASAG